MNSVRAAFIVLFVLLAVVTVFYPDVGAALLMAAVLSAIVIAVIRRQTDEPVPVIRIFLLALALRLAVGLMLEILDLRSFFGADAFTYDNIGNQLALIWSGKTASMSAIDIYRSSRTTGPGWGMNYFVGAIYFVFGRNILVPQTVCGVIGAATAPAVYVCAQRLFNNSRVAKTAAILVAVMPAMIIWSSQLLKDGLVIFLLVLAMIAILRLQDKFSIGAVAIVVLALTGILSLRFYIFYMAVVAAAGSLFAGSSNAPQKVAARLAALVLVGVALTYFGVIRIASGDLERTTDLSAVQRSRSDLATAESGFDPESDVSTPAGAIATIPIGLIYLFLAPFPWAAENIRQLITVPEVLMWYITIPLIISGMIYTVRQRFRRALPIIIFSVMLTFAYSIFQGNVGTAYRQRTQIQVFLFIFAAVGFELIQEKRRDRQMLVRRQAAQLS